MKTSKPHVAMLVSFLESERIGRRVEETFEACFFERFLNGYGSLAMPPVSDAEELVGTRVSVDGEQHKVVRVGRTIRHAASFQWRAVYVEDSRIPMWTIEAPR